MKNTINNEPTISEIFDTLTDKQKAYLYTKVGQILDGIITIDEAKNYYISRRPDLTVDQKIILVCILKEAIKKWMGWKYEGSTMRMACE